MYIGVSFPHVDVARVLECYLPEEPNINYKNVNG